MCSYLLPRGDLLITPDSWYTRVATSPLSNESALVYDESSGNACTLLVVRLHQRKGWDGGNWIGSNSGSRSKDHAMLGSDGADLDRFKELHFGSDGSHCGERLYGGERWLKIRVVVGFR